MIRISEIKLPLLSADDIGHSSAEIKTAILKKLIIPETDLSSFSIFKRGVDARKRNAILLAYIVDCEVKNEAKILAKFAKDPHVKPSPDTSYHFVATAYPSPPRGEGVSCRPVIIGFGPAGIFAALILAQAGFRPIVLERGKPVRERTKDTWGLWRNGKLNPESNVQYGEGGAGTFSDGKLYSQIKDPKFYGRKVISEFILAGAPPEIAYVSHPHIGTFRLVGVVETMRETIKSLGGEVRFESKVEKIALKDGAVQGVMLASGEFVETNHLILAVGHSARDTFEMLYKQGIYIEAKPFSIGFRIEHPQSLIDHARYGNHAQHPVLGAADYKLVHHASNGRSVYSFCMCPGGTVVAAASEPECVVTNGMSQYSRNERNANAGIVVGITPEVDFPAHPLAGMELQRQLERQAYTLGGNSYAAPGQLVGDFLANKASTKIWRSHAKLRARRDADQFRCCAARICNFCDSRGDSRVCQAN